MNECGGNEPSAFSNGAPGKVDMLFDKLIVARQPSRAEPSRAEPSLVFWATRSGK